jgi:uncharacterized protein
MLWAVICMDNEDTTAKREELLVVHRAYLDTQDSKIFFSGPLQSDDVRKSLGSLFVLRVNSRSEAQAYIDNEPFNKAGIFTSVRIFRMRKGRYHPHLLEGL